LPTLSALLSFELQGSRAQASINVGGSSAQSVAARAFKSDSGTVPIRKGVKVPLITISSGQSDDLPPDDYRVVLVSCEPTTFVPKKGRDAGERIPRLKWTFEIVDREFAGARVSDWTPPQAGQTLFRNLNALLGRPPKFGETFEEDDLVGLEARATVTRSESGWPKIENLRALPPATPRQPKSTDDDLPF
jgi:hypothetical protein